MTQIEKIKAEIERRMKINQWDESEGSDVAFSEDKKILSFIESLEKEQDVSFESAWDAYAKTKGGGAITVNVKTLSKYFYELGCRHIENTPKIKGWIARDENGDLYAFVKKPERSLGEFELKDKTLWEDFTGNGSIRLPKELFPDITWESDPIEVELTISELAKKAK